VPQFPPGSPFEEFFKDFFDRQGRGPDQPQQRRGQSLGSGFVIDPSGYVVTNNHVIDGAEEIRVIFHDNQSLVAKLVGKDQRTDLALLKVEPKAPLPAVKFGDSDKARVGDWVVAIGNPFGLGGTVTQGIVSARQRDINAGPYDDFIQTDASINRGNSGGPLFDMRGNVIGINNAIFSPSGGSVGIGFAIPAEIAAPIVEQLRSGREIMRGYLGVGLAPINEDLAASLGIEKRRGEFVQTVQDDSPAARAGLKPGDIITKVNGKDVTAEQTVSYLVANMEPGAQVPVELLRDGKKLALNVTLGKRPTEAELQQQTQTFDPDSEEPMAPGTSDGTIEQKLGMQVLPMSAAITRSLGVPPETKGVVIGAVDPNSDAARKGLRRGDIILSANYQEVATVEALLAQVNTAVAEKREAILLRIQRRTQPPAFIPIRLR
jgi:serine protease Do